MKTRTIITLTMTVLFAASLANSQEQARDYTRLFPKFHKLGLPDVTGAQYVTLNMYSGHYYQGGMANMHDLRLTGNAWLLKENKEGASVFVANNCKSINHLISNCAKDSTKVTFTQELSYFVARIHVHIVTF